MFTKSYAEYQEMIGERVKQYRISMGMSQRDLEEASGVSMRSISRLEQGASVQMESMIKILTALRLSENLELLIPDQTKRPSYYLNQEKPKQRVHKKESNKATFKWGDEE